MLAVDFPMSVSVIVFAGVVCRVLVVDRIGIGHLRKPPGVELIPCRRKPLKRTRTYATRCKCRYEANKCSWTQPLFRKAPNRGVN
jgi:hypothetical protein